MPDTLSPYFEDRDPSAVIKEDAEELWGDFASWRERNAVWAQLLDPRPGQVDTSTAGLILPKQREQQLAKSEYLSNFVPTGIKDIISRLGSADPVISIAIKDQPEAELEKIALIESFCLGILNRLDARAVDAATDISWRRQVDSYATAVGKIIGIPHLMREDKKGNKEWDVEWPLYDPFLCAHDFGVEPPRRFICQQDERPRVTQLKLRQYRSRYPDSFYAGALAKINWDESKSVTVTQYWLEDWEPETGIVVWNGMLVGDELVYLRRTDFKRWPIKIMSVGASIGSQRSYSGNGKSAGSGLLSGTSFMRRHAEPLQADAEHTERLFNQAKSLEMDGVALMVRPPYIVYTNEGGAGWFDPAKLAPGQPINAVTGELAIQLLNFQNNGVLANSTIIADLQQERRFVIPDVLRGGQAPPPGSSGYLYFLNTEQGSHRIRAHAQAPNTFIESGLMEIVAQFHDARDDLALRLEMRSKRGERMGQFYSHAFHKADIPESTVLHVESGPLLAADEYRALQMAMMAKQVGIDDFTIFDRMLHLQDPVTVRRRYKMQQVEDSPMNLKLLELQDKRQKADAAAEEADRVRRNKGPGSREHRAAQRTALIAKRDLELFESILMAGPGQAPQPALPPGAPPEVQPPEAQGFESPDAAMSLAGVLPSPESRAGSRPGRAGRR